MDLPHIRARILQTPFLRSLPGAMRERCAAAMFWSSAARPLLVGDVLYVEGKQDSNSGAVLVNGDVEIEKGGQVAELVEAPDILGEIQQFTPDHTRTATVRVVSEGLLLTFNWSEMSRLAEEMFSDEELTLLKRVLEQYAWRRCADLFDRAAREAGPA